MTTENIQINIREDGSRQVIVNMNAIADSADSANLRIVALNQAFELLKKAWNIVSGLGSRFAELADAVTLYETRLRIMTKTQEAFNASQQAIYDIAQRNNAGLKETANLYLKAYDPVRRLGGGLKETSAVVEGFTASLRIGGASAQESASSILQFSQALASGRLQGDEFRSLAENAPRFMQVLADSLGVATGELKGLSTQGKLTSDVLANALLKNLELLRKEASQVGDTISGSFVSLGNDTQNLVGDFDKLFGVTATVTDAVGGVSLITKELAKVFRDELKDGTKLTGEGLDNIGIALKIVGTGLEIVLLLASDIAYVFKATGREIGGIAAQLVAMASGDFKIAGTIREQMIADGKTAEAELKRYQDRISGMTDRAIAARDKLKAGGGTEETTDYRTLKATATEKDLYEVRLRLSGITKNYMNDLSVLQKQLDDGKIGMQEYIGLVSDLATKTYNASTAGRAAAAQAKANDTRVKVMKEGLFAEQAAFKAEEDLYASRLRMLDVYYRNFDTSDAEYYGGQKAAREEFLNWEAQSYNRELGIINNFKAKTPKEVEDKKLAYAKLTADHEEFLRKFTSSETEAQLDQLGRDKKTMETSNERTNAYLSALNTQATGLEKANEAREESRSKVELESVAILNNAIAYQEQFMAQQLVNGATEAELAQSPAILQYLRDVRDARLRIANAMQTKESDAFAKKAADQAIKDWQKAGTSIADSLSKAFGKGGKAIGEMFKAYSEGVAGQLKAQKDLTAAKKLSDDDPQKIDAINRAKLDGAQAELKSYGDITSAAQTYFDKGTSGYNALAAASGVLRAAEVALSIVKGVNAVLTQGEGDPYSAFARMAAMAAIVVGLGVALSGSVGSGPNAQSAEVVQKSQGTGSVLGDSSAKSNSISRSIERLSDNSDLLIPINQGMLNALNSINAAISGVSNLVARTTGIQAGTNMNIQTGTISKSTGASIAAGAQLGSMAGGYFGPVGMAIGAVIGGIVGAVKSIWGKTKQEIIDSGLQFGGKLSELAQGQGYEQYATVQTTKSSWFGLSKKSSTSVQTQGLSEELSNQFGMIFKGLNDALVEVASGLGENTDKVKNTLENFAFETTKISLKGLSGEELNDAINTVISKALDDVAKAALPELIQFQQVGEGFAETVIRIASDYQKVDAVFSTISSTFSATGISSVAARERLIQLSGGIEQFTSDAKSFADNFIPESEQIAKVQKYLTEQLAAMGFSGINTRDKFRELVTATDATTEAGAKQWSQLMALQAAFATAYPVIEDTKKSLQEIADQRTELQNTLDELTLSEDELNQKRRATIEVTNQVLYDQVVAAEKAKKISEERKTLQDQLDNLTMTATELLDKQRAMLDASNQSLFDQIQAATKVQKVAEERKTLENELNSLTLNSVQLLNLQRDAVDESNRAIFDQIQAIKAQKAAYDLAIKAGESAISGLSKSISAQKEIVTADYKAQVDAINTATKVALDNAKTQTDVAKSNVYAIKSIFDSLDKSLSSTVIESDFFVAGQRRAAQALLQSALIVSKAGGSLAGYKGIDEALSTIAKPSEDLFNTFEDYARDQSITSNTINDLRDVAKDQLDYGEMTVEKLTKNTVTIQAAADKELLQLASQHTEDLERLDLIYLNAQYQLDEARGINNSVLSVKDAVVGVQAAIAALSKFRTDDKGQLIPTIPTSTDLYKSPEYLASQLGTNQGVLNFTTMSNNEVGAGSQIQTETVDKLTATIKLMTETIEKQQETLNQIAASTEKSADIADRTTAGGGPQQVILVNQ